MRRLLLAGLGAGLLGLGAWIALEGGDPAAAASPAAETGPGPDSGGSARAVPPTPRSPAEQPAARAPARIEAGAVPVPGPAHAARPPVPEPAPAAEPPAGLRVLVVDPGGVPVRGVEVRLQLSLEGLGGHDDVDRATTDARGLASLRASSDEERAAFRAELRRLGAAVRYRVEAQVPLEPPPSVELGPEPEPAEVVRLQLPPSGSLEVRVTRPDGSPAPGGCWVSCGSRPRGAEGTFERGRGAGAAVVDGLALVPVVALDRELLVTASGGNVHHGGQTRCAGPLRAGEQVKATVVLGPLLPRVAGRLVGQDGAPLSGTQVGLETLLVPREAPPDAESGRRGGAWVQLDDDGRFEGPLTLEPGPNERLVVRVQEGSRFARWDGVVDPRPAEVIELGTLVLAPDPDRRLLVSGTLRSEDGAPLATPGVDAWTRDPEGGRWERLTEGRVEVARDGSFEAWTVRPELPESFRLSAGARGWLSTSATVAPGAHVDLVLERAGGLAGRFTAADPAALPLLVAKVRGEGHGRDPDVFLGAFQVDGLPPGTYTVTARGRDGSWGFGAVEGVVVRRGEVTRDPRLDPLDLGDGCRLLRLRLVDGNGAPLARAVVSLADPAGRAHRQTDEDGALSLLVPAEATELELSAGPRDARLRAIWTPAAGDGATLVLR